MSERVTYLGPLHDGPLESELMRFTMFYDGGLRPTQRDAAANQIEPLADHKMQIRKNFHAQLKRFWHINQFLREHTVVPRAMPARIRFDEAVWGSDQRDHIPLVEYVAKEHEEHGYNWVPLVRKDWRLRCALHIHLLRHDGIESPVNAGDLDNRVKTIIDALTKPSSANQLGSFVEPAEDEKPFFCLLEDDDLVTEFSVETDTLLTEPISKQHEHMREVRATIAIEIQPYLVDTLNLSFA